MTHNPHLPPVALPCARCDRIRRLLQPGLCVPCTYWTSPGLVQVHRHRSAVLLAAHTTAQQHLRDLMEAS